LRIYRKVEEKDRMQVKVKSERLKEERRMRGKVKSER
jgi:hypothetical protein